MIGLNSKIIILISLLLMVWGARAQDVAVTASISPGNGCDLTATETVSAVILNNSATFIASNTVTVSYTIDGGQLTQELLGAGLASGSTWNFTFSNNADISPCGSHEIKVWVDLGGDTNPNNDTLTWNIQNDCTVIPGQVQTSKLVCELANQDTLTLNNWTHGTITDWIFSTNNGATWTGLGVTDTFYIFTNLSTETQYQVVIDGGFCPDDTSDFATISIQPEPVAGTLDGSDSLCASNASGSINVIGNSAGVLDWEVSTDDGTTWVSNGNTTTTENYTNLTQTTWYRALIDGNTCPNVYTDTAIIYVDQVTNPGVLETDTLICEGQSVGLEVNGNNGDVLYWESSLNTTTWNNITNTTNIYNTGNMSVPTYYRVINKNGKCPADTTNTVYVDVQAAPTPGTIDGAVSTCAANATGVLEILGSSGGVIQWDMSTDNGGTWVTITNTTTTQNFTNLSQTTWYRALIDGGACSNRYTDTAIISVDPLTVGGVLSPDTTVCEGDLVLMTLTNSVGTVLEWQESIDGTTWTTINSTATSLLSDPITATIFYRVIVKSGICAADTSNQIEINALPLPTVDAGADVQIIPGDSTVLNGTGGVAGIWTPGEYLSDSTIQSPAASPPSTTTFTYTIIGTNGCFNADQVIVSVGPPIPPFSIKNTLTPNEDGFNDTWIIEGLEAFPSTFVAVYNIYGKELFRSEDYQNDWGGTYNGKKLPDGTYMYVVIPGGTEDKLKGNLTILGNE